MDEARDKGDEVLDVSTWERSFPDDIPEQLNGYAPSKLYLQQKDCEGYIDP